MVYCDIANSRNAVTAFVVCLLSSFQRPSFTLGFEISSRARALNVAEVTKTTALLQEGEWIYFHFPASSRGFRRAEALRSPRPLGTGLLPQVPVSRQEGFAESPSRFGVPPEWGLLLLPLGELRQEANRTARSGFLSTEGRCFYPSILLPSTPSSLPRNTRVPDGLPVLQGRCFYPLATGPSTVFRKSLLLSSSPSSAGRVIYFSASGLSSAWPPAPAAQASQGRGSMLPRRNDSATAAASGSFRPASRARSYETMASS